MRRFLLKCALAAILLASAYGLHLTLREALIGGLGPDRFLTFHEGWVRTLPQPPRIVLMGSSTVKYGLDANALDSTAVNLAGTARTPVQSLALYRVLAPHLDGAEVLVYGLDPWVFADSYKENDPVRRGFGLYRRVFAEGPKLIGGVVPDDRGSGTLDRAPLNFGLPARIQAWEEAQFTALAELKTLAEGAGMRVVYWIPPRRSDWEAAWRACCADQDADFRSRTGPALDHSALLSADQEPQAFMDPVHMGPAGRKWATEAVRKALDSD